MVAPQRELIAPFCSRTASSRARSGAATVASWRTCGTACGLAHPDVEPAEVEEAKAVLRRMNLDDRFAGGPRYVGLRQMQFW